MNFCQHLYLLSKIRSSPKYQPHFNVIINSVNLYFEKNISLFKSTNQNFVYFFKIDVLCINSYSSYFKSSFCNLTSQIVIDYVNVSSVIFYQVSVEEGAFAFPSILILISSLFLDASWEIVNVWKV